MVRCSSSCQKMIETIRTRLTVLGLACICATLLYVGTYPSDLTNRIPFTLPSIPVTPSPPIAPQIHHIYLIPSGWSDINLRLDHCASTCILTPHASEADVHVWFPSGGSGAPPPRLPHQRLVIWNREPRSHAPTAWEDTSINLAMTYNLDSNVPISYVQERYINHTYGLPVPTRVDFLERKEAVWLSTNCNDVKIDRQRIVTMLQQFIHIENRGPCLNNAPRFPTGASYLAAPEYRLWIGIEKTSEEDYVTEKLWNGFYGDALPVYIGSSRASGFAPPYSFVDGLAFGNVTKLGLYLRSLVNDYDRWVEYFAWRAQPVPTKLTELEVLGQGGTPLCRLCACLDNTTCTDKKRAGDGGGVNVYSNQWIASEFIQ